MKELQIPYKAIDKQIIKIAKSLNGENNDYFDMRIGDAHRTIFMLELILDEDFESALDLYHMSNWSAELQLDYKIVDFLSIITDEIMGGKKQQMVDRMMEEMQG